MAPAGVVAPSGRVTQRCASASRRGQRLTPTWNAALPRSCAQPRLEVSVSRNPSNPRPCAEKRRRLRSCLRERGSGAAGRPWRRGIYKTLHNIHYTSLAPDRGHAVQAHPKAAPRPDLGILYRRHDHSSGLDMTRLRIAIFGLACACLPALASAQVTLYEQENFHGRTFAVNATISNLDRHGFNDRASLIIVDRGDWQVCEDADFRGRCIVLRPGQYPALRTMNMNNKISSLRRVGHGSNYAYAPPPPPVPPYPYYPHYGEALYTANVTSV